MARATWPERSVTYMSRKVLVSTWSEDHCRGAGCRMTAQGIQPYSIMISLPFP